VFLSLFLYVKVICWLKQLYDLWSELLGTLLKYFLLLLEWALSSGRCRVVFVDSLSWSEVWLYCLCSCQAILTKLKMVRGKVQVKSSGRKTAPKPNSTCNSTCKPPLCTGCGAYITDDIRALQCDRCQSKDIWKCADCLNLSPTVYDSIVSEKVSDLKWFCDDCTNVVMDTKTSSRIDDLVILVEKLVSKIDHMEAKLGSDIGLVEKKLEDKADMSVVAELVELEKEIGGKLDAAHGRVENKVDSVM